MPRSQRVYIDVSPDSLRSWRAICSSPYSSILLLRNTISKHSFATHNGVHYLTNAIIDASLPGWAGRGWWLYIGRGERECFDLHITSQDECMFSAQSIRLLSLTSSVAFSTTAV